MYDVSVLGTGLMGSAIVRALLRGGNSVTVWNRTAAKMNSVVTEGAHGAATAAEAVLASSVTISVLVDSEVLKQCLGEVDFQGRTIINLATGTPEDATDICAWVTKRGGNFLSGTISAYPKDIGEPGGGVNFSGPSELWTEHQQMLMLLGGYTRYLGPRVTDACTLDMAMLVFYMAGIASFQEAIVYAETQGVSAQRLMDYVAPTVPILHRELEESITRVATERYETDEATIGTFHPVSYTHLTLPTIYSV